MFSKTATNGTTIIPDPRSLHIDTNVMVSFLYSKLKGRDKLGTPGSTWPKNKNKKVK